jgi:dipeptidyl aminopeptidase/acylaminoacyl peptidase
MANVDGTGARALTPGKKIDASPSFSPDGRSILFTSNRSGTQQLWTLPVDGGEARQLTDFALGLDGPVWSPDGRFIACTTEVFPEVGIDVDKNKKIAKGLDDGKTKVHVADELLYRHWTSWHDGKRTHIVLVDAKSGAVVRDLTPGKWEAPIFRRGGGWARAVLCLEPRGEAGRIDQRGSLDGPGRRTDRRADGGQPDTREPRLGRIAPVFTRRALDRIPVAGKGRVRVRPEAPGRARPQDEGSALPDEPLGLRRHGQRHALDA